MSMIEQLQFLERLRFFDGQRLLAADLQDVDTLHRELRELHNRSLHQPGVGSGFAVTGAPGDREVSIGPGYAIDADGHEIVHTRTRVELIPPVPGDAEGNAAWYDLAVSSPDDAALEESETREGICRPRGVTRLREEPEFCWIRSEPDSESQAQQLAAERRILIARASIQDCQLKTLSVAERLSARPAEQPYIACGRAPVLKWSISAWVQWQQISIAFVTIDVDTSGAHFGTTPHYSAGLEWTREEREQLELKLAQFVSPASGPLEDTEQLQIFPILGQIESPTPRSFQFTTVAFGSRRAAARHDLSHDERLTITWIGVE